MRHHVRLTGMCRLLVLADHIVLMRVSECQHSGDVSQILIITKDLFSKTRQHKIPLRPQCLILAIEKRIPPTENVRLVLVRHKNDF